MSWEGYYEHLCERGHRRVTDGYEESDLYPANAKCSCGAAFVWTRQVDQTNGDDDGPWARPYPFEVAAPAVTERCNLGHEHVIEETRYVIPPSDGMAP